MAQHKYIPDLEVAEPYSVSRATVWRWVRDSKLPPPVRLSEGCTRWLLSDIEAWEASRKQSAA
jgi:predicted DNA-binding transcriptional regulator AlpA